MDSSEQRRQATSRRKRKRSNRLYSLDVLTDGSEGTVGSGILFLSVWQQQGVAEETFSKKDSVSTNDDSPCWWEGTPKARYALSLGSDTCSRLATDQRYKLAATRAVFDATTSLWGYKALQLALTRSGAKELHVVSSHPNIETIVADRRDDLCPMVHLCDLGELSLECAKKANVVASSSSCWWQVYSDEYLIAHAKEVESPNESLSIISWAYLYTLYSESMDDDPISFLVLPPGSELQYLLKEQKIHTANLPVLHNKTVECNFVVAVHPVGVADNVDLPVHSVQATPGPCPNLLVRARRQAQVWHRQCPKHFPWTQTTDDSSLDGKTISNGRLTTGTSLCWWAKDDSPSTVPDLAFHTVDRLQGLRNAELEMKKPAAETLNNTSNVSTPRALWPDKLKSFFENPGVLVCTPCDDDNEIDIDCDEEDSEDSAVNKSNSDYSVEFFSLGTGCAAPSAYRGASAYLIRQPSRTKSTSPWCVLLEAGEGFVTQYLRHVSSDIQSLLNVSLIWVSHAHWDHYGGLVPLLSVLRNLRMKANAENCVAPLVLAPRMVLRYCENMLCQKKAGEWFYAAPHEDGGSLGTMLRDWNQRNGSIIAFWENVLVDHSCRSSYGCGFGVRFSDTQHPFTIAFSGDSRPCLRFVQFCRRIGINGGIDFLLHEATFDDGEKEMSIKKKHSTVQEAIRVGQDVRATKVLLSHFSQRYDSIPKIPPNAVKQVGFALDGMRITLV